MQYTIIDVREPDEYRGGHVKGALNIPPSQLLHGAAQLVGLPKDQPIIVYCRTGSRSNVAIHILNGLGYNNIINGINKDHVETMLKKS
jgi:phage shock protein E